MNGDDGFASFFLVALVVVLTRRGAKLQIGVVVTVLVLCFRLRDVSSPNRYFSIAIVDNGRCLTHTSEYEYLNLNFILIRPAFFYSLPTAIIPIPYQ